VFRRSAPPPNDVEAALSALAALRQAESTQEDIMSKFDIFEKPEAALALRSAPKSQPLARNEAFEPLAPRAPAPHELIARPSRSVAPLAPHEPTRRVLEPAAPKPGGLPCQRVEDGSPFDVDPRTYVDEFAMTLTCCGRPLEITWDGGEEVTNEFQDPTQTMVEWAWHAVCPHCHGEHHHALVRPLPADYLPR
jgi:hypothetical protein